MKRSNLYAKKLEFGMGIGVFTPSTPANVLFRDKYQHGLKVIADLGFNVIEGEITKNCLSEGYRTSSPKDRAAEFMSLTRNPKVHALISTIGGSNSSSLVPYLDFDEIRESRKVICGYSDVTSLHISILNFAGLRTFYGPAGFDCSHTNPMLTLAEDCLVSLESKSDTNVDFKVIEPMVS